jgi:uncharacterized protein
VIARAAALQPAAFRHQEGSSVLRLDANEVGRFCWLDLAAVDANRAKGFYGELFGWQAHEQAANDGNFFRISLADRDVGSMYQLSSAQSKQGIPSHWTPYIRVDDLEGTAQRVAPFGGQVIVRPFTVTGIARIALIADSVGAFVGLWESIPTNDQADRHGQNV